MDFVRNRKIKVARCLLQISITAGAYTDQEIKIKKCKRVESVETVRSHIVLIIEDILCLLMR